MAGGDVLKRDIQYVKGVGEKRAVAYRRLGIHTLADLLRHYPRDYEDRRALYTIRSLPAGENGRFLAVVAAEPELHRLRKNLTLLRVRVFDETDSLRITFFNQPYVKDKLQRGETYEFYGKITRDAFGAEMSTPEFAPVSEGSIPEGKILPVYALSAGLTRKNVAVAVQAALAACADSLSDILPASVLEAHALRSVRFALETIHAPVSPEALAAARRRIVFEELFVLTIGLMMLKNRRTGLAGTVYPPVDFAPLDAQLPFRRTAAQMRVCAEAAADLASGRLMNRLIQGDVGSGKTAVCAYAAYQVIQNGHQAALMTPTEILAVQHFRTFEQWFAPLGIRTVLITGKMPAAQKRAAKALVETGAAQMVIGTHAVLSQDIAFRHLGLVICDEQQRFGVNQRAALSGKGDNPHMLVMSATPIPRTLALIFYGDLDLSVLDELPAGRQKIDTFRVDEDTRPRIERFVRRIVAEEQQVYIVCPLIDEGDGEETRSVTAYADRLAAETYGDCRVATLHGRMKAAEKDAVMQRFLDREIDILVSTTVVEVGVDNPNAALMVIENAERFGLSQLHQLRGRVGRGAAKSYCVLFQSGGGETARARLDILCRSGDGYAIAERDLDIRGPGSFFGTQQHGLPSLKLASLSSDMAVLHEAQSAGKALLDADPALQQPENAALRRQVFLLFDADNGNMYN